MDIAKWLHRCIDRVFGKQDGVSVAPFSNLSGSETIQVPSKVKGLADAIVGYRRARNSVEEDEFSREIRGLAHTFNDWLSVAENVSSSSSLGKQIPRELMSRALTFDQYEQVHRLSTVESDQSAALEKMASLAKDITEKLQVYDLAGPDGSIGQEIFKQISSEKRSDDEWEELFNGAQQDSSLEHFAATMLIEVATSPERLADLACANQISGTELEKVILEKMRTTTATFDDWQTVVTSYDGEAEVVAKEKMVESATTIEEMLDAADYVSGDDGTEKKLKEKAMSAFIWTEESCRKVLDDCDSDHALYLIALEKLLETVGTSAQCLKIYFEWEFGDDEHEIIFNKLATVSTQSERSIIALVAEEGSDLQEWAEKESCEKI